MSVSIDKIINFSSTLLQFKQNDVNYEYEPTGDYVTRGGVLSRSEYAWLSNGPRLEIINTKNGAKVGAWTFGWVLKDFNTQIVCVDEIQRPNKRSSMLAVALDCTLSGGIVCIFDFLTSRVVRAIQLKDKITSLHVIDSGNDIFTLPGTLRNFDGILAIGCSGGDVLLIDLCREICDEALTIIGLIDVKDELNPCQLKDITRENMNRVENFKEFAIRNDQHLSIHLNIVLDKRTEHFTLKGPKGEHRIHVNKAEVAVSAVCYCPQLGSLLVGYNFGAFQLYDLMTLNLIYTSPICDEHIPITHFALQEPSDDPRAFYYVWVMYSAEYGGRLPLAVLYALNYNTREHHEGYGILYQEFQHASVRFQMELGGGVEPEQGSCLHLSSINKMSQSKDSQPTSLDDNLALCVMAWSVTSAKRHHADTFLCLFDLNQWYKAQMPSRPGHIGAETYMEQLSIFDPLETHSKSVLDVRLIENSVQQFIGTQKLEEHFCPNSLSFNFCSLRHGDVTSFRKQGVQKLLLSQIQSAGALSLIEPESLSKQIIEFGLSPLFVDLPRDNLDEQREFVLNTALEHHLIGWLCKCASEWANGSFLSAGCSLNSLITWAHRRATALKEKCDEICIPLFDYSETRLDANMNKLLQSSTRQLKQICSLYRYILEKFSRFLSNAESIREQYDTLRMVVMYFKVLQWLLNVGLLPECPLSSYPRVDEMGRINAPYPAETLADMYNHRRALLKIRNEKLFATNSGCLFIDNLIERECGGKILHNQWRDDGGNGLYPPPSLQSLLRIYLVENVDLFQKHLVVMYVFLDLARLLDQERYHSLITYLIKFPAVFSLSPGIIKLTQGFWQLDHGDFNAAKGLLLNPLIQEQDLKSWHHVVALRSFLLQDQHKSALRYLQVRKPAIEHDDDILTVISLYVANGMLDEAFYFERQFMDEKRRKKILLHLFNEARRNEVIRSIIYRCLNRDEEIFFLDYLKRAREPLLGDLVVYYHIVRSHYLEAFDAHNSMISNPIECQGLVGKSTANARDKVICSLKKLLPDVSKDLLNFCNSTNKSEMRNLCQKVQKPTPMSVFVHNSSENVKYKSTFINAALAKSRQTFGGDFEGTTEDFPFLKTPTTPRATKRSSVNVRDAKTTPSLAKRPKLSLTPIVKRKTPIRTRIDEKFNACTPHSILKGRSVIGDRSKDSFDDDFCDFEKVEYTPIHNQPSPRKSLIRTPPVVRFEGLKHSRNLSGITENSSETVSISLEVSGDLKSTSNTEDDSFHSLENETKDSSSPETSKSPQKVSDVIVTPSKVTVRKRKTLCRQVLEHNTISAILVEDPITNTDESPKMAEPNLATVFEPPKPRPLLHSVYSPAEIVCTSSYSDDVVETVEKEQAVEDDAFEDNDSCDIYDDLTQNEPNHPENDPEMNNFEYSGDLVSMGGGDKEGLFDKELDFVQVDLTYGQHDTLQHVVMEESVFVPSTPTDLDRNIFHVSSSSPTLVAAEITAENETVAEEPRQEPEIDEQVIEIGSSTSSASSTSHDGTTSSSSSSSSSSPSPSASQQGDDAKLSISYEKNIYDSYESEESSTSREGNGGANGFHGDETRKSEGLFHGYIINVDISPEDDTTTSASDKDGQSEVCVEKERESVAASLATTVDEPVTESSEGVRHVEVVPESGSSTPRRLSRRPVSTVEPLITKMSLRRRAVSVDTPSNVFNENINQGASTSSAHLDESLPVGRGKARKAKSTVDDYSMSRRITRRQADVLRRSFVPAQHIDPIVLLEKSDFDGNVDPEERKIYETSPSTSTSSVTLTKAGRRLRSTSQLFEDVSNSSGGANKRQQRILSTDDVSSVSSTGGSPPKKGRTSKTRLDKVGEMPKRVTRSRSKSMSSEASSISNVSQTRKSKQQLSTSTLPKIDEEETPKKRTTRKKK